MGISERKIREKEQRKKEIIDTAERLFFSRGYDDVSMDGIAREVELNKATLYLYFDNKEALFAAIVLRGVGILQEKYRECMEAQVPGMVKVALMGEAYYRFSQDNPYTAEIGKGYGTCRTILQEAVREGMGDGTIRDDLDPFPISMYLMISFMGILSMEDKWKRVIETEGLSYEQYCREFFRFIIPAVSTAEGAQLFIGDYVTSSSPALFSLDPVKTGYPKTKRSENHRKK